MTLYFVQGGSIINALFTASRFSCLFHDLGHMSLIIVDSLVVLN